jgi:hypothetical protein
VFLKHAFVESFPVHVAGRDGEAVIGGNIFVWETNSTGIGHWRDGMEWASQEVDGFEVGEAIDGSGLMKKHPCQ